jgi:hypothetical protein
MWHCPIYKILRLRVIWEWFFEPRKKRNSHLEGCKWGKINLKFYAEKKLGLSVTEYNNTLHCLCNNGMEISFREESKNFLNF